MRFVHDSLAQRVRFAAGEAATQLADGVRRLDRSRVMVICAEAERALAERVVGALPVVVWHDEVVMHVPRAVAERARAVAADRNVDVVVPVGGGSTTGLAKAVALTTGLPIVAVPTTYAGSEATNVWGMTDAGRKVTGVDDRVLPRAVVYDASLTVGLPVGMSVASGLNAVAHCVDSLWAPRADPINAAFAGEGIRALDTGLRQVVADPGGLVGREQALYGAYLAAVAFASAGSGLHHKICHVLGGLFDLPHAQTHAIVLPHIVALNAPAAPEAERRIASAFAARSATGGLAGLRAALGAPSSLRDCGMPEDGIAAAVEAVLAAAPPGNPVPVTPANLTALLCAAWEGEVSR
ncbi:maleylacetate reductase [Phytohabitans suffuscus]|uniref:Maleylacetate reductase n=1 Tax=Phytohabitans suffuscus TaxID=624315 RepID=A0A6F8YU43_9ACTN|nr:maleylacetate reductase [Phytohabitans suffuscus]BCB89657.1 maleylacetate reductase [Phytohabitans suffuscus]